MIKHIIVSPKKENEWLRFGCRTFRDNFEEDNFPSYGKAINFRSHFNHKWWIARKIRIQFSDFNGIGWVRKGSSKSFLKILMGCQTLTNLSKAQVPARIGDLKISTRMCPIGTVIRPGMTGTKIPNAFKTDDYCMPGHNDVDLTALWCGKGFEGENGVCHDIDECESMETFWKCQGM